MEHRRLGNSGLQVSEVGLGCNNFGQRLDEAGTRAVVDAAIDVGIDFFDTADMYGSQLSEVYLGKALRGRRDDFIVATKCGFPMGPGPHNRGASRRYVISAVEASLRRLDTDYIDLFPDPSSGSLDAHRRDPARAGRLHQAGQDPLRRLLQLCRLADRRRPLDRAAGPSQPVRHRAEPHEPAGARRVAGGHSRLRSVRTRHASVFSARETVC